MDFLLDIFAYTVQIPTHRYEVCDGNHFTEQGQQSFHRALAHSIPYYDTLLIICDSTIDYHNWDENGYWTGWANESMTNEFAPDTSIIVDAVSGSGFKAHEKEGNDFLSRLKWHVHNGYRGPVLFVGGWSDIHEDELDVFRSIQACSQLADKCTMRTR